MLARAGARALGNRSGTTAARDLGQAAASQQRRRRSSAAGTRSRRHHDCRSAPAYLLTSEARGRGNLLPSLLSLPVTLGEAMIFGENWFAGSDRNSALAQLSSRAELRSASPPLPPAYQSLMEVAVRNLDGAHGGRGAKPRWRPRSSATDRGATRPLGVASTGRRRGAQSGVHECERRADDCEEE